MCNTKCDGEGVNAKKPWTPTELVPPLKETGRKMESSLDKGKARAPLCFLHIPKSGGISVHEALERSLPEGSLSPKRWDSSFFCPGFSAFEELTGDARTWTAADSVAIESLGEASVVSGHFCLESLLRVTSPLAIATVLREPRARLLSLYAYWRLTPGLREWFDPYTTLVDYAQLPLDGFLSESRVAQATDNKACRMLLQPDSRIPVDDFIRTGDIESVVAAAVERLDSLGFVGVTELDEALWRGLSQHFGVTLSPVVANMTGWNGTLVDALPLSLNFTPRTLDLFAQRTAGDALIYEHALRSGVRSEATQRLADAAFANQLARVGDLGGRSAVAAAERATALADLRVTVTELRAQVDAQDGVEQCSREADPSDKGSDSRRSKLETIRRRTSEWVVTRLGRMRRRVWS